MLSDLFFVSLCDPQAELELPSGFGSKNAKFNSELNQKLAKMKGGGAGV